ncbi:four helix bundle protein [Mesotoga sp. B105.6.4]|uniref:four helix bundle protein n=1 Tax=Mesotoga sp. B105.6.4 TaxID=1582224 RepID=UPI0015E0AB30|nr:four helix bundle protein [Mesotoga sp. B105.6.4]
MNCFSERIAISGQRKANFLNETVAQLEISFEFGYMNPDQLELIEKKAESINRMLWKLPKSLEKSEDR